MVKRLRKTLGVAEVEGKEDFDCVLVKMVVTNMVRKYSVHRTNEVLTEVRMPRVKVNKEGTDLLVEVRTQRSTDKASPSLSMDREEAKQFTVRAPDIRKHQQLKIEDGISAIKDTDVRVDLVDMDGNVVGTIAESDAYETDEEIFNEQGEIVGYAACSSNSRSPEREKSGNGREETSVATQPLIPSLSPITGAPEQMPL